MDYFRREHIADEIEHLLEKRDGLVFAEAENLRRNPPVVMCATLGDARRKTRDIRIRGDCRTHVPGNVHFGDNADMTFGGISHHFTQIRLRIVERPVLLSVQITFVPEVPKNLKLGSVPGRLAAP